LWIWNFLKKWGLGESVQKTKIQSIFDIFLAVAMKGSFAFEIRVVMEK